MSAVDASARRAPGLSPVAIDPRIAAVAGICVLWVFWPTFTDLAHTWSTDPQMSHGWVVPLFSAFLLWARRKQIPRADEVRPVIWGVPILVAGLLIRSVGVYFDNEWLLGLSLLPCLVALVLLGVGWAGLRWTWPAILFLIFMVPLPQTIALALGPALQRFATVCSNFVLQTLGYVSHYEGNVIVLTDDVRIGVVEACSGLAMLMTFFALTTALVMVSDRPLLERAVIFASAIPIALLANMIRITSTAMFTKAVASDEAHEFFHDYIAGYGMPIVGVLLLMLLVRIMDWILVPNPPVEGPDVVPHMLQGKAVPVHVANESITVIK